MLEAIDDEFGELEAMLQIFAEEYARAMAANAVLDAERLALIAKQRVTIAELATPVIEVWDNVVTLPIVGSVDTERSVEMTERLLRSITTLRTRNVIIDLTGVDVVDTATANHLIRMVRAAQMLGSNCVLTGLSARIAHTLVELDVDLGGIRTLRSLKEALEEIVKASPAGSTQRKAS